MIISLLSGKTTMIVKKILLLGAGGFVGSNLRYWLTIWAVQMFGTYYPVGTFIVNISGSLMLGLLTGIGTESAFLSVEMRLLIGTGMLGALTTFSTFSVETLHLFESGRLVSAGANLLLNVIIGFSAAWAGLQMAGGLPFSIE